MGGHGSGRIATKTLTDTQRSIDIAALMRVGRTSGGLSWSSGGRVASSIRWALKADALEISEASDGRRQVIPLVTTSAGFGGRRRWFQCACGQRCRVIYLLSAGARCRGSGSLSYRSQRQRPEERALRMAEAISARLGGVAYDHFPDKPARMHRLTYQRLQQRHDKLVRAVEANLDATA